MMEAVAASRRRLPPGGIVPEDYVFQGAGADGTPTGMRLSELFASGKDSLVIYSLMFPRDPATSGRGRRQARRRCFRSRMAHARPVSPSSTSSTGLLSTLRRANFAVVAKAPLPRILTFARGARLATSAALVVREQLYNRDYLGETAEGTRGRC